MLPLLFACVAPEPTVDPDACDPRALAAGEVRARRIPCSDELIPGGEGRVDDWLLENAHARYVVRGTYAALTLLGQEGGTLIDAAMPGGPDLLLEYAPDGDRTAIVAENGDGEARLVLPGVTYRLGADDTTLWLDGASSGTLQGLPAIRRTGGTLADDAGAFFGVDAGGEGGGGRVALEGVTRAALSPDALWPDGDWITEPVDADVVVVSDAGKELYRAPVVDGSAELWLPTATQIRGEREGCVYEGLTSLGCGWLDLRVADDRGEDLRVLVADGLGGEFPLPPGGGRVPVGPVPRPMHVWAGPRHGMVTLALPGGDVSRTLTLTRYFDAEDAALAALSVEVAPDASSDVHPTDAATALAAEDVAFAVLLADDEIPTVSVDPHDPIFAEAGSRAAAVAWSWPWSPNGRRAAHGAVPWDGLTALDLLAVLEGGQSAARLTIVDAQWVARALIEADPTSWDPRPDALWLGSPTDLDTWFGLLDAWMDIAAVGPRTWIEVGADRNVPAFERGIVDARTSAGNGPRVTLTRLPDGVSVHVDAPPWMGLHTLSLRTSTAVRSRRITGGGSWKMEVPGEGAWVVATVEGRLARPGSAEPAWAVSAPLWLERP